jgi:Zn-dependent M28 family amino/carboxypeptidase
MTLPWSERGKRPHKPVIAAAVAGLLLWTSSPTGHARPPKFPGLGAVPRPAFTGAEIVAGLEDFVNRFPLRQAMLPNNDAAAQFLADEAEDLGYDTRILKFQAAGTVPREVKVVEALKRGTKKPDEWIVFLAHYDIANATFTGVTHEGAYDNGSGANLLRFYARSFAKLKTRRSIAIVWPGDEDTTGFVSTAAYAKALRERGQKVSAVLGFDMAGIGYPAPYCICIYWSQSFGRVAVPIIHKVNFDYLGLPSGEATPAWPLGTEGNVCECGPARGGYGEGQFTLNGYPTIRWHGMSDPGAYPWWHTPMDTVDGMELVAGSRANLEEGMLNTFLSGYYTAIALDQR